MIIRRLKKWTYAVCLSFILSAFWLVGSSLIFTKNTSALRHEYLTIPIFKQSYFFSNPAPTGSFTSPGFSMQWISPYSSGLGSQALKKQRILSSKLSENKCIYDHLYYSPFSNLGQEYDFYQPSFVYGSNQSGFSSSNYICQTNLSFGSSVSSPLFPDISSVPPYNMDSFGSNTNLGYSLPPYSFEYDHFYLKNSGEYGDRTYSHVLKFSDFYQSSGILEQSPSIPSKFYELYLPFDNINTSVTGDMTPGRAISFDGQFSFPGVVPGDGLDFAPNFFNDGIHKVTVVYFKYGTSTYGSFDLPCTFVTVQTFSDTTLKYSCSGSIPSGMPSGSVFIPYMRLKASDSDRYILDTTSDWGWSGAFLTTDNDSTPGAVISEDCQGSDCQSAPGNAYQDYLAENPEAEYNLGNLFNFSISNPFQPLFGLFIDSSTCYNIPIIAGFLHVEDAEHFQYCPWFPSSVRQVLTPVFGLSASMLLFGFIVKWLKSSSGNFESDSSGGAE